MAKKQLFTLEYNVRCSPAVLFDFFATAAGFKEWFADKVVERDKVFVFTWNGSDESATVIEFEQDKQIRFQWDNAKGTSEYFEFRIDKTDISNQTILTISDFADPKDVKDAKQLWEHQIKDLFYRIGIV